VSGTEARSMEVNANACRIIFDLIATEMDYVKDLHSINKVELRCLGFGGC